VTGVQNLHRAVLDVGAFPQTSVELDGSQSCFRRTLIGTFQQVRWTPKPAIKLRKMGVQFELINRSATPFTEHAEDRKYKFAAVEA